MSFAPPTAWAQADLGAAAYAPGGGAEAVDDAFSPLSGRALEEAGRMLDEDEARQPDLVQQLRAETGPAYAPPPSGVRSSRRALARRRRLRASRAPRASGRRSSSCCPPLSCPAWCWSG